MHGKLTDARMPLGLGVGWRKELALDIDRRADLGFVEVIAESIHPIAPIPPAIANLQTRGVKVVPHGIGLSLGSAEPPESDRLRFLARIAERLNAPLVSEHVAIVRAGGVESGHLLAVPRTRESLNAVARNIRIAQKSLPVPLAVENIATLVEWPGNTMTEAEFLTELVDRTGVSLLLDLENLFANSRNHGESAAAFLDAIPLDSVAYVHVAGGHKEDADGLYHDTHAEPVPREVLELLTEAARRANLPGVLLERDDRFPTTEDFHTELDRIALAWANGRTAEKKTHVFT